MGNQTDIVIEATDVHKTFHIGSEVVHALRGVSLKVPKGRCCAVIGRSGSGKSTLLHVLGTLDSPSQGQVVLNGQDVSALSDADVSVFRNRTIGFVFQMNNLLPEFSALENVMMPGMIAGWSRDRLQGRAQGLLTDVGLQHRVAHRPGELSGGEQQRVAIARSLLMQPSILLADEPTGNLDKSSSNGVVELLLGLCASQGVTMMMVTHDLNLASVFPYQVVMEDGVVVELGGAW